MYDGISHPCPNFSGCLTHLPFGQVSGKIADDNFNLIFFNEDVWISIEISLNVPKGPIDKKSALVQVMAWRRTGDTPLPEPMLTQFTDAYMRQ